MSRRLNKLEQGQDREELLREHAEKIEREKQLIMYSGVSFFMVLFIGFWFVSFTGAVKNSIPEDQTGESLTEVLAKLKTNLDKTRTEVGQLKTAATQLAENLSTTTANTITSATTSQELDISELNVEISNQGAEKLETNIESSQPLGASTSKTQLPISQ